MHNVQIGVSDDLFGANPKTRRRISRSASSSARFCQRHSHSPAADTIRERARVLPSRDLELGIRGPRLVHDAFQCRLTAWRGVRLPRFRTVMVSGDVWLNLAKPGPYRWPATPPGFQGRGLCG
jgi:hypothetical protein